MQRETDSKQTRADTHTHIGTDTQTHTASKEGERAQERKTCMTVMAVTGLLLPLI